MRYTSMRLWYMSIVNAWDIILLSMIMLHEIVYAWIVDHIVYATRSLF